jgi:dynein heavy chain
MVFVDSRNLGWRPYLWRWLNGRTTPGEADALRPLFERYAAPGIAWVIEGADGEELVKRPAQSVPLTALNLLAQLCGLLDATLAEAAASSGSRADSPAAAADGAGGARGAPATKPLNPQTLEGLFIFCCVWSVGACLLQRPDVHERDRFDAFLRRKVAMAEADADV